MPFLFEDSLLGWRLFEAGLTLDYHPELLAHHDHAITLARWVNPPSGAEERLAVAAATLITVGLQVVFSSFLLSILGLRRRDADSTDVQN